MLYDDRPKVSAGVKFKDAELLGVPFAVVVGRGLAEGSLELRDRRSGERTEVAIGTGAEQNLTAAVDAAEAMVRAAL